MVDELRAYKGKTGSSCPNCAEWVEAFGDAEYVFAITITSRLSGSYNAACMAKQEYEETHPGAKVKVIDSLSAGPQLKMLVDKIIEKVNENMELEDAKKIIYNKQNNIIEIFSTNAFVSENRAFFTSSNA